MVRRLFIFVFLSSLSFFSTAQDWVAADAKEILGQSDAKMVIEPSVFELYHVDDEAIKAQLWTIPHRNEGEGSILYLPTPHGLTAFKVHRYDLLAPELAEAYPQIRAFHGRSLRHPTTTVALDYTDQGLRAMISNHPAGQVFIDHVFRGDKSLRIMYTREHYAEAASWECQTKSRDNDIDRRSHQAAGDCQFRRYRLAVATTGEYSNYHGASSASQSGLVLSAVTTTINRVNQVYRQDVNVEMQLVANTDQVFHYNGATDPYSGNSVDKMNANQAVCDNAIGNSNYDIGHIFDTGSGGVATLGSICSSSIKARGYTGGNTPEGDPFDIDYVSHEIGHQFGANHTQNNGCNRVSSTAMEPGSASTIMGYAGICTPNVQNNSDPYFHAVSIGEMAAEIATTSCAVILPSTNGAPMLPTLSNYTIPSGTPFMLDIVANDPNNDDLVYCWEQYDNDITDNTIPNSTWTAGPIFRSFEPVDTSVRIFPRYSDLASGVDYDWEELPTVARDINFRLTVRDVPTLGGCTSEVDTRVTTTTAGPFTVTSPTASTYNGGESVTVTWDVAGTDSAPINCSTVDIYWTTGTAQPTATLLVAATANSGSATITIPNQATATGKILVKCSNNIFFNVNDGFLQVLPDNIDCTTYSPNDLPIAIPGQGTPTITSQISVTDPGQIFDVNLLNLTGTHTWVSDLEVQLISPQNTSVLLFDDVCQSLDDFNVSFDEDAASGTLPCPPTDGNTYKPEGTFSAFSGQEQQGTWTLQVRDQVNQDGGSLDNYALEICIATTDCDLMVTNTNASGPGSFAAAYDCYTDMDTIIISSTVTGSIAIPNTLTINDNLFIHSMATGVTMTTGNNPVFAIGSSGFLRLLNVGISCDDLDGPCISNQGSLRIENCAISNTQQGGNITNSNTGMLQVVGQNSLN